MLTDGKPRKVNWEDYCANNFQPFLPSCSKAFSWRPLWKTCGTTILSLITGLNPGKIESCLPKGRSHWSDTSITDFLQKRNYKTIQLTRLLVTNTYWENYPIHRDHVLILNVLMDKEEASYFLLFDNVLYHNFSSVHFNNYFFINKPLQSAILVWHKKWK